MFNYQIYRKYLYGVKESLPVSLLLLLLLLGLLFYKTVHKKPEPAKEPPKEAKPQAPLEANAEAIVPVDTRGVKEASLRLLQRAFRSADVDRNKEISLGELELEISRQIKDHILNAMRNNFRQFFSLDKTKKNGQVDWEEYYEYFLRDWLSLDAMTVSQVKAVPQEIPRDIKESISSLKAAWSEVARNNPHSLNIDEFLSLQHPESSMSLLIAEVEQLLSKYDVDSNGKLTRQEFVTDPYQDLDPDARGRREEMFDQSLDANKDGVADRRELIKFLDPKNQFWSRQEAGDLLRAADADKNGALSFQELLVQHRLFLQSKMIDPSRKLHQDL